MRKLADTLEAAGVHRRQDMAALIKDLRAQLHVKASRAGRAGAGAGSGSPERGRAAGSAVDGAPGPGDGSPDGAVVDEVCKLCARVCGPA